MTVAPTILIEPNDQCTGVPAATRRVLHVINGEHFSGAERVQDLLAMTLPEFGFEAGFVTLKSGRFAESRRSKTTPVYPVPMKSRFSRLCGNKVARIVREQGYKLIHAHTPRSLLVAGRAARLAGVPLVYHVHSPVGRDCGNWMKNRVNTWMESRFLRQCAHMICVSSSLRNYMESLGHKPDRLSVVHNGVPCENGSTLQLPKNEPCTIGIVALFRPRKGLETLVRALACLRDSKKPVRLLAVGPFETEEYRQEILQLVNELKVGDLIEWTGFETNVNARLRQMQVMALPSLYGEGLPMVVLEAMAVGLPVVASRVEGVPEAIRDGIDGFLTEPGDSADLASKIRELISSRGTWNSMSRRARQRQRVSLSDRSMSAGVAAIYDQILSR